MSRIATLALLLSLLALPSAAQAQAPRQLRIVAVDQSAFPAIEATIQLTDDQGVPIVPPPALSVQVGGVPVAPVSSRPSHRPGATLIVTDLSGRMSESGAAFASRFQLMQPLVSDLVSQLQTGDQRAGLIVVTQTVTIAHDLTNDLVAIGNTLARANPKLLFAPEPAASAPADAPYPLDGALIQALDILAKAPPDQPRTLLLFAAGDPQKQFDAPAVRAQLERAASGRTPVQLLVYGFATSPEANTQLQTLAGSGQFTAVIPDGKQVSVATKRRIDAQFGAILARSELTTLSFTLNSAPSGATSLIVSADGASDTVPLQLSGLPPRVSAVVSSTQFQDKVRLTVQTEFQQAPITSVEYLLGGRAISSKITSGPSFAYELNVYDPEFQSRFKPGEYELVAAAQDERGMAARSAPLKVRVFAPPAATGPGLALWLPLAALALLALGAVAFVVRRRRKPASTQTAQQSDDDPTQRAQADEEPTGMVNAEPEELTAPVAEADDEETQAFEEVDEEITAALDTRLLARQTWVLEVVNGDTPRRIELRRNKRNYDLGRTTRDRTPDIPFTNPRVSRDHAVVELLANGPELIAGDSTQGTFFGPERRALAPRDRQPLADGDIFWLSPEVQINVSLELGEP